MAFCRAYQPITYPACKLMSSIGNWVEHYIPTTSCTAKHAHGEQRCRCRWDEHHESWNIAVLFSFGSVTAMRDNYKGTVHRPPASCGGAVPVGAPNPTERAPAPQQLPPLGIRFLGIGFYFSCRGAALVGAPTPTERAPAPQQLPPPAGAGPCPQQDPAQGLQTLLLALHKQQRTHSPATRSAPAHAPPRAVQPEPLQPPCRSHRSITSKNCNSPQVQVHAEYGSVHRKTYVRHLADGPA